MEYIEDSDDSCADPDYVPSDSEHANYETGMSYTVFYNTGKNVLIIPSFLDLGIEISTEVHEDETGEIADEENTNQERQGNMDVAITTDNGQKLTRKRKRKSETWKMNVNKVLCQSGKEYRDVKGNIRKQRCLKTLKNCEANCKFLCSKKISQHEREEIFKGFWALTNNSKLHFYAKNTERFTKLRTQTSKEHSRRKYSFKYYFHIADAKIRVCKIFFLSTLDISQQRINYFHDKKKDSVTGIPLTSQQGRHPKKTISAISKDVVRLHISQIPRVESHYCRVDTKKEYVDGVLNMNRLYSLYTEFCAEKGVEPVKKHIYSNIFNYEYNIEFLKPKKDRCDVCEEHRLKGKSGILSSDEQRSWEKHELGKQAAKQNRDVDRRCSEDQETAIICFDLENVFALPRSNISCFFYSRKLNTYNLTAHCSLQKQAYCCIWSEGTHGRQGSDIASGLIKILNRVLVDFPQVRKIILWSDSCVPQNKNSIMSLALMKFLEQHPTIVEIIQKFGEPGHSSIQEVDNLHSQIERRFAGLDIFSPLGLLRLLPAVNQKKPFKVFHMRYTDFKLYKEASQIFNFKKVPYASLKQIKYCSKNPMKLFYKLTHYDESYTEVPIFPTSKTRLSSVLSSVLLPDIRTAPEPKTCLLPFAKVADLTKLFKFMPPVDVTFIKTMFKQFNDAVIFKKEQKKLTKGK